MEKVIYEKCSGNAFRAPCLGDLVRAGLLCKGYVCDETGNVEDVLWTNISDETFIVEDSFAECGYIELKPGETC